MKLSPFERWMVKSNLQRIAEGENPTATQIAILRANGYPKIAAAVAEARLEALRVELRAERISMGELVELQDLADEIQPGDVELAEPAGIPEEEFAKRGPLQHVKVLAGNWKGHTGTSHGERTESGWLVVTVHRIGAWKNPTDQQQTVKIALADGEFEAS
jgi:hypothetical protein